MLETGFGWFLIEKKREMDDEEAASSCSIGSETTLGKLRHIDIKMACPLIIDSVSMQDLELARRFSYHYAVISLYILQ